MRGHRSRILWRPTLRRGAITFVVDQSYIALALGSKITLGSILPPFFENLLPEGALLQLIQKEFDVGAFDNFGVLG